MTVDAYDIWTGNDDLDPAAMPAGWADPTGPGIDVRAWPRSPRTGQPMFHCFTLQLPEAYRRRGPHLVAVSVFQWEDELYFDEPSPQVEAAFAGQAPQSDHPFWADLARSRRHPQLQLADDGVQSLYAMIWLDEAELTGPRVTRPAEAPEYADGEQDSTRIRETYGVFGPIWLTRRDDPNAGLAPLAYPADGDAYVDVPDRYDRFHSEHLGGTDMCPDGIREGLSPWYLEVSRLGGLSHGGDQDLALDLDGNRFLGSMSDSVQIPQA